MANGKKVFVIDLAICNGCHNCQIVCKDEHVANDWSPIAKPQPEIGQFWIEVKEKVRGTVPKVKVAYRPNLCMHCDDAPCLKACPSKAIYKRDDGMVVVDAVKCRGSRLCVDACPYEGVIWFNEDLNIAQKCTGCAHLLDDGWTEPRCADACPTLAIKFLDEDEAQPLIASAKTVYQPELADKTQPRVYYLNLPKKFIGGTVYDPVEEEVIIGATVDIQGSKGSKVSVETDSYGDFWVEGLEDDVYDVTIKQGAKSKVFSGVDTVEADVNLGDIPLT